MSRKPLNRADPENTSVHEALARWPGAGEVFHRFGIDTCCGGDLPLSLVAKHHEVDLFLLLETLEERSGLTDDRRVLPLEAHGMPVVSFGFFLGEESPAVWRGPLVAKAVDQLSRGVVWPELDFLLVDLPPGTGDVPLSLTGAVRVDGALVVTTPQRLAVIEARKYAEMFGKLQVATLGIVENLSRATCECGRVSHPFAEGGGERLAGEIGVDLLAQIPFDPKLREAEERGIPAIVAAPGADASRAFASLAERVADRLAVRSTGPTRRRLPLRTADPASGGDAVRS